MGKSLLGEWLEIKSVVLFLFHSPFCLYVDIEEAMSMFNNTLKYLGVQKET